MFIINQNQVKFLLRHACPLVSTTTHRFGQLREGMFLVQSLPGAWKRCACQVLTTRMNHRPGLSGTLKHKMSKTSSFTVWQNHSKSKIHQIYLTATTRMQGRLSSWYRFPDTVRSGSSFSHLPSYPHLIVHPLDNPSRSEEPTSLLQSRILSCTSWHQALFVASCTISPYFPCLLRSIIAVF